MARITPCLENGKVARFCAKPDVVANGSTEFIVIRGRRGLTDNDFAYYLTKWDGVRGYAINQMTGSSGRQRVPTRTFDHLKIAVPPLEEQRAIAHILGALDDKIELNRRMNETLEAMARAIFKSWFVDFDPVRAKAAGRDPALPKPLADLFPDSFEDSELGLVPEGWNILSLPEVIDVNPTRRLSKGCLAPYLEMKNMPTTSMRAQEFDKREFSSGVRFINGDTLVARITPCLENGKTCYVDFLKYGQVGWGSTEYIVLRPLMPVPSVFAYFLARMPEFRSFAITNMSGTSGRQRVPASCFKQYQLAIPPFDLAKQFSSIADSVIQKMKSNDEESRTLAALRDTLLPKLISGELRLQEAKSFIGKTAG